jgi:hypothetical protein
MAGAATSAASKRALVEAQATPPPPLQQNASSLGLVHHSTAAPGSAGGTDIRANVFSTRDLEAVPGADDEEDRLLPEHVRAPRKQTARR